MKGRKLNNIFLLLFSVCVLLPFLIILIWSFADNWKYPLLLPEEFSSRGIKEVWNKQTLGITLSSMLLSSIVGLISTIIGGLTARAIVFYDFKLKKMVRFLNLLPLMIPATAFAMGMHVIFIRMGISDTVTGVIIAQLICGLPYSVNIMTDVTTGAGNRLEEQARSLGASAFQAFFNTSFYAMMPGFLTSFCMAFIISFGQYFVTLIFGGGAVKTLSMVMVPVINSGDRTLSASYSLMFLVSTLAVFIGANTVIKKIKTFKLYG